MSSQCNSRNIEFWVQLLELVNIHVLVLIFLYKIYCCFCRWRRSNRSKRFSRFSRTTRVPRGSSKTSVFQINIQIAQELFQRNLMASVMCSVILGDLNRFFPVVMNVSAWEARQRMLCMAHKALHEPGCSGHQVSPGSEAGKHLCD